MGTVAVAATPAGDDAALRRQVEALSQRVAAVENENRQLREEVATLRQDGKRQIDDVSARIDSVSELTQATDSVAASQAVVVKTQGEAMKAVGNEVSNARRNGMVAAVALSLMALAALAVALLARRRTKQGFVSIEQIKATQEHLSEESIKLDSQLLQLIERQIDAKNAAAPDALPGDEHRLALKVADELARIEMNLHRMDPDTRGLKQLSRAVERIRDNFLSRGYEIVPMLGKPYHEGMKVSASFVPDDTLPAGSQVITGIVKPQVNFNGKMIQSAEITVSQNID